MQSVFLKLLECSLKGSVVILAVMALRLVLKKAPKRIICLLWLLAGLRLLVPFQIESPVSLQPERMPQWVQSGEKVSAPVYDTTQSRGEIVDQQGQVVAEKPLSSSDPSRGEILDRDGELLAVKELNAVRKTDWQTLFFWGWLTGVAVMGVCSLISYLRLKKTVRSAVIVSEGIWVCGNLDTAFVLGFFHPQIYLPANLTRQEREFVLSHERTHLIWKDHWWKLLGYTALALHWFNPLVWVGYVLLCRDIELACDEHVVRNMDMEQRKAYSSALLSCSSRHMNIAACPVAFGETNPKQRILNVLNYKRPSFWISLTAIIAVVFVLVCLMTSPTADSLIKVWGISTETGNQVSLFSENRLVSLSAEADVKELMNVLKDVTCDTDSPVEAPQEEATHGLAVICGKGEGSGYRALNFSKDCTLVWSDGDTAYPVENAALLCDYFATVSEGVYDRETAGSSFAAAEEPWAWLQGINPDAVSKVEICTRTAPVSDGIATRVSSSNGILTARAYNELLELLNKLPETAISTRETLPLSGFETLQSYLNGGDGLSLTFYDDVNQMVVMLRLLEKETIQLILIDELEKVADRVTYLNKPPCWLIEDKALLKFLQEMRENPPIIMYGLSREQLLLRQCRAALQNFQGQECYSIQIVRSFNGDALNSGSTQYCYGWGEDWLRYSVVGNGDFCSEEWYLCKNGQKHSRCLNTMYDPGNGEGSDTGWVQGFQRGEGQVGEPWLKTFQWKDKDITFLEERTEGDYRLITICVQGSPYESELTNVSQYQVTFVFDAADDLCQVIKNYTQTHTLISNGREDTGITQVSTVIRLLDDSKEEIVDILRGCAAEAAQSDIADNSDGSCAAPGCTDPNHDHYHDHH